MSTTTVRPTTPTRFIRMRELLAIVPLSRSRLSELIAVGRFPRGIKLSERARAWDMAEVEQWLAERRLASRKEAA
jgi:prophage regulatory protein